MGRITSKMTATAAEIRKTLVLNVPNLMGFMGLNEEWFNQAALDKEYAALKSIANKDDSLYKTFQKQLRELWQHVQEIQDPNLVSDYYKAKLYLELLQKMAPVHSDFHVKKYLAERFNQLPSGLLIIELLGPNGAFRFGREELAKGFRQKWWLANVVLLQTMEDFFKEKQDLFKDSTAYTEDMYAAFLLTKDLLEKQLGFHVLAKVMKFKLTVYKSVANSAFFASLVSSIAFGIMATKVDLLFLGVALGTQPLLTPQLFIAAALFTVLAAASIAATVVVPSLLKHFWRDKHLVVQKNRYVTLIGDYFKAFEDRKKHNDERPSIELKVSAQLPYSFLSSSDRALAKASKATPGILLGGAHTNIIGRSQFFVHNYGSLEWEKGAAPSKIYADQERKQGSTLSDFSTVKNAFARKTYTPVFSNTQMSLKESSSSRSSLLPLS